MKTMKLRSPGKVNFRLEVLKKRPDGYHDLRMLNSMISIYDDIELETIEKGVEVICENDPGVPDGEENIVYKACKEIMAYSNKNIGMRIKIKKNVPSASGLGGGSSNAASVISGINSMLKINLSQEKLIKIGLRFGADIPFFLYGAAAIAEGVGESLTKVKKLPKTPLIVVSPTQGISTKTVYETFERQKNGSSFITGRQQEDFKDYVVDLPDEYATKKSLVKFLHNDLEPVTSKQIPLVNEIKDELIKEGALAAQMTGSGPSVFGIFQDKATAEEAASRLEGRSDGKYRVFVAETI